jgi:hypothetical protein
LLAEIVTQSNQEDAAVIESDQHQCWTGHGTWSGAPIQKGFGAYAAGRQ